MYKVKISKKAADDMKNIMGYIALDNPRRAESFIEELLNMAKSILSSFPLVGKVFGSRRVLVYNGYYIIYKVSEDKKEINLSRIVNPANYTAYRVFVS